MEANTVVITLEKYEKFKKYEEAFKGKKSINISYYNHGRHNDEYFCVLDKNEVIERLKEDFISINKRYDESINSLDIKYQNSLDTIKKLENEINTLKNKKSFW